VRAAQGDVRAGGLWAASCDRKEFFFSGIYFTEYSFGDFVQILSNLHTVSSIQNNPTKFCFRKLKSDRNFSVKFKVNEFI
jgi:hypothetical protein